MNLLPAILLAIPIACLLIAARILIVLQNRKQSPQQKAHRQPKP